MMKKLMLIAGVLGFSACADANEPAPSENIPRTLAETDHLTSLRQILPVTVDEVFQARRRLEIGAVNLCDLRPQDGPCALACDPNSLGKEYVQEGGCAMFLCQTDQGDQVKVGACNNP